MSILLIFICNIYFAFPRSFILKYLLSSSFIALISSILPEKQKIINIDGNHKKLPINDLDKDSIVYIVPFDTQLL